MNDVVYSTCELAAMRHSSRQMRDGKQYRSKKNTIDAEYILSSSQ